MAKELPYFKFEPSEWENGNIQMCSREDKGLYLDLCAIYWIRLGDLPLKLASQKLCGGIAGAFDSLCNEEIITINDGYVCIDFLNEQLLEFKNTSKQNSENARIGWEQRKKNKANASASKPQSESDAIKGNKRKVNNSIVIKKEAAKEPIIYFPNDILLNEKYLEFLKFRKEIGKSLKEASLKAHIKKLNKLANNEPAVAVEILENSIANGYIGIFELKTNNKQNNGAGNNNKFGATTIPNGYNPEVC